MIKYFKISKSRLALLKSFTAALFRKEGRPVIVHLLRQLYLTGGRPNRHWVLILKNFLRYVNRLHRHQGLPGVVKHLKVASVVIQQVIAGHNLEDLTPLGCRIRRAKSGLPAFIPIPHRQNIRNGDSVVIRYWSTLCSIYRDIRYEGMVTFKSIVTPSDKTSTHVEPFIKNFTRLFVGNSSRELAPAVPYEITKSAPSVKDRLLNGEFSSSFPSLCRSFLGFQKKSNENIRESLRYLLEFSNSTSVLNLFEQVGDYLVQYNGISYRFNPTYLGKLAVKEEAAGKMRVFAMVDPWTQWALSPLHKWIYSILRKHPMDGTFNQMRPLSRVPFGRVPIYSYDLTAATDRLPISIQVSLLSELFGKRFAEAWKVLLAERVYQVSHLFRGDHAYHTKDKIDSPSVKYSVGQPMGARSSWGMLAYAHHFIVQLAAWTANVVPRDVLFEDYALLGDDIVIWNKLVAEEYLRIMTSLGVEIGLSKSVISPEGLGLEFAKRTLFRGVDVSPAPIKETIAAHRSTSSALELQRKYSLSDTKWLRFLGYGYKVTIGKNTSSMKVIRTIKSIPRDYLGLQRIFSFLGGYLNPGMYHRTKLYGYLITLIIKESIQLEQNILSAYWKLNQWECSTYLDSKPVFNSSREQAMQIQIRLGVLQDTVPRTLAQMWSYVSSLRMMRETLEHQHYLVRNNLHLIPPYTDSTHSLEVILAMQLLFKVQADFSSISIDSIMYPKPTPPSQDFIKEGESAPVIRRWNRWMRVLSKTEYNQEWSVPKYKFNYR